MSLENEKIKGNSLSGSIAFFLAIAPILDPYIVAEIGSGFTLKINEVLMIFFGLIMFCKCSSYDKYTGLLLKWLVGLLIISIFGNLFSSTNLGNSMKNLIVWFIYAFFLMYVWKSPCRDAFFKYVQIIAVIAATFVLLQFVCGNLGIPIWNGRIPGLTLGKYDGWSGYIDPNTKDIRPNGFFQEASYVGIYLAVAYAQAFKEGKMKLLILYALSMLSTTSMVSIITLIVITLYMMIKSKKLKLSSKLTRRVIIVILIGFAGIVYLSATNEAIGHTVAYIMKRITNFSSDLQGTRMSSTKYRLLGHIDLFQNYSIIQKFFGVGIAQYSQLFGVSSYSNVWVTTLLNSGILGTLYIVACFAFFAKRMRKDNFVFFIIFVIVLSSDYQWFSWYFIYMISACLLTGFRDINDENNNI